MQGIAAVSLGTIFNVVFKSVLVLSFAFLIGSLIRHKSAAAQHIFWFLALSVAGAAPILYLALPKIDFKCLPAARAKLFSTQAGAADSPAAILLLVYFIGLVVICAYLLVGRLYIHLIRRAAEPIEIRHVRNEMACLARGMGIAPEIALLASRRLSTPIATGILRPAVILPNDAAGWPESVIRSALAHELAHIRRRDILNRIVGFACCAINWFNPLAWYALRRMIREQEFACDMRASQCFRQPAAYAEGLLTAASAGRRAFAGAATGMTMSGGLIERLSEVLKPKRENRSARLKNLLMASFLSAVLLYPIAALNFIARRSEAIDEAASARAEARAREEKAWGDYYRSRGIEPDRMRILKKTEESVYFSYTLRR